MMLSGAGLRTGPSKSPARPCGHDLCQGSTIHQLRRFEFATENQKLELDKEILADEDESEEVLDIDPFARRATVLWGNTDRIKFVSRLAAHSSDVGCGSMLSKKSFGGNKRNFLNLLMRFVRSDVRDLIASQKNDHGPSYRH